MDWNLTKPRKKVFLWFQFQIEGHSVERRYLSPPGSIGAIFKKSTVIGSHISSIKTRKIIWAGPSIAGAWQGLWSTDGFQIVIKTSLSNCTSLVKFSWKYDQQFSFGRVRHCWCLAEVCTPRMISKILWGLSWLQIYLWQKFYEDTISSY